MLYYLNKFKMDAQIKVVIQTTILEIKVLVKAPFQLCALKKIEDE